MAAVEPTVAVEVELSGAGAGWTAITADVLGRVPLTATYGIQSGGGPADRCAQPGSLSLALNNAATNSGAAQGYYSPGHANARSGFDVGIAIRLSLTYSSTTYIKWVGRIASLQVQPGSTGDQAVLVVAHDVLDACLRTHLRRLAVQESKRGDQVFAAVVANMPEQPAATSIKGTGRETYVLACDAASSEEGVSVLEELQRLALSEAGFVYPVGSTTAANAQTLVYESRTDRAKANTNLTTFAEGDLLGMEIERSREAIINRVLVRSHPRRKDAAVVVLYTQHDDEVGAGVIGLGPGDSQTIVCPYIDPTTKARCAGVEMVTPAATTDYTANASDANDGTDLTSSLGVAVTFGGTAAEVVLTNNHATTALYVHKLQLRGKGVHDEQATVSESRNTTSETTYGPRTLSYDAPYQADPAIAQGFADHFRSTYDSTENNVRSISFLANRSAALMTAALAREPGDRIGLSESVTAVDTGYHIQSVSLEITPKALVRCTFGLTPASRIAYWFIGTAGASEVGETTRVGF